MSEVATFIISMLCCIVSFAIGFTVKHLNDRKIFFKMLEDMQKLSIQLTDKEHEITELKSTIDLLQSKENTL